MWDNDALLRDGSENLTETANGTALDCGPDLEPITYELIVPSASGTSPTLDAKVQESDDNSSWRDLIPFTPQITAAGVYHATAQSNARYRRLVCTVGGTNSPSFGKVFCGLAKAGRGTSI